MKGMNVVFPMIPLNFLLVKWFGYCSLSKLTIRKKCWRLPISAQRHNLTFVTLFWNSCHTDPNWDIGMKSKPFRDKIPSFHNMKEAGWFDISNNFLRNVKIEKRSPPFWATTQMNFHVRIWVSMTYPTLLGVQKCGYSKVSLFLPPEEHFSCPRDREMDTV